jgi:hypothetical protein
VVVAETVEAASNQVGRHRPWPVGVGSPAPVTPTLNLAEAVRVGLRRHARGVYDNGHQPVPSGTHRTRHLPARRHHEAGRLSTRTAVQTTWRTPATMARWGLALPGRWWRAGLLRRLLRIREPDPPARRSRERLGVGAEGARAQDMRGMGSSCQRRERR